MAREPDKSTRETERAKSRAGTKNGGADESADPKSGPSNAVELLKAQHSDLQATLAKGSDVNADRPAIVKEFAAAWLAHSAVEQEILVPALKDGRVDEEKMAAVAIQRDIINLILADLLQNESDEFAQAKLEALAKQFAALVEGADGEDGLFARVSSAEKSIPGLNSQMKARYARLKQHFANMDESLGEAMVMLAPQRLSVTPSSRQNRREYEMNRYSNVRDRDEQGRFVSDDDRRYSRGGSERDEYGRFMSESGSRSRGRYEDDDDDNRRYSRGGPERDEHGRFMSEGGPRFRGRYDDEDEAGGRWAGNAMMKGGSLAAAARTRVVVTAAGSATPRATPRLPAAAGKIRAMARAAGMAIRKATPRPHGAGGNTKAITGVGRHAMTRCRLAAGRVTTTTMSAAMAAAATAVGPATRRVTRRPRGAAGRTGADGDPIGEFHRERPGESLAVPLSRRRRHRDPRTWRRFGRERDAPLQGSAFSGFEGRPARARQGQRRWPRCA